MSKVGHLFFDDAGDLAGGIRTLNFKQQFALRENQEEKPADVDPEKWHDWDIVARSSDGELIEIGRAFKRTKTTAEGVQKRINLFFEDPDFPDWAQNMAAFPNAEGTEYRVVT